MHWWRPAKQLADPSMDEQYGLTEHYRAMLDHYGSDTGVKMARKHLGWYTKGLHGSAEFRNMANFIDDAGQVLGEIERFYEPFLRRQARDRGNEAAGPATAPGAQPPDRRPDLCHAAARRGRPFEVNPAAESLLGRSAKRLIGRDARRGARFGDRDRRADAARRGRSCGARTGDGVRGERIGQPHHLAAADPSGLARGDAVEPGRASASVTRSGGMLRAPGRAGARDQEPARRHPRGGAAVARKLDGPTAR
jgi:hypothetical protein